MYSIIYTHMNYITYSMGWLRLVGSIKLSVSFAEYCFFYRALLQKRPIILSILLTEATPSHIYVHALFYIICSIIHAYLHNIKYSIIYTANPTWGVIFQSSKLKARTSLLPSFNEKRRSSFELWALKQHSKMSPEVGLAVLTCTFLYNM